MDGCYLLCTCVLTYVAKSTYFLGSYIPQMHALQMRYRQS